MLDRETLLRLSASDRSELISSLSEEEAAVLMYSWEFWARESQMPPPDWLSSTGLKNCWLLLAGRGYGKTKTGSETLLEVVQKGMFGRIALVAEAAADARDVIVEGDSGILRCAPPWFRPVYEPSKRKISEFRTISFLGAGKFAQVDKVEDIKTKQIFACKKIQRDPIIKNPEKMKYFRTEVEVLRKLNHPNILKCHEKLEDPNHFYLILDYCDGGDLEALVKSSGGLEEARALRYFAHILSGLRELQNNQFMHRDLKPANIFLLNDRAVIGDFGFVKNDEVGSSWVGTPMYAAPEVLCSEGMYTALIDNWSLGLVLYYMLHGTNPWVAKNVVELSKLIKEKSGNNLPFEGNKNYSPEIKTIIKKLVEPDSTKRMTLAELSKASILQKYISEATSPKPSSSQSSEQSNKQRTDSFNLNSLSMNSSNSSPSPKLKIQNVTPLFKPSSYPGTGKVTKQKEIQDSIVLEQVKHRIGDISHLMQAVLSLVVTLELLPSTELSSAIHLWQVCLISLRKDQILSQDSLEFYYKKLEEIDSEESRKLMHELFTQSDDVNLQIKSLYSQIRNKKLTIQDKDTTTIYNCMNKWHSYEEINEGLETELILSSYLLKPLLNALPIKDVVRVKTDLGKLISACQGRFNIEEEDAIRIVDERIDSAL